MDMRKFITLVETAEVKDLDEATWHQQQAQKRNPVSLQSETEWVVVTDPPNEMKSGMGFATEEKAKAFMARGNSKYSYILPPKNKKTTESAIFENGELDVPNPDGTGVDPTASPWNENKADDTREQVYSMFKNGNEFVQAYVEAIMFTEAHSDNPDLQHATIQDFAVETMNTILNDCRVFQDKVEADGIDFDQASKYGHHELSGAQLAAHDFWLTRNNHGAGFWDGDWNEDVEEQLTKLANTFKSLDVYASDGKIYFA